MRTIVRRRARCYEKIIERRTRRREEEEEEEVCYVEELENLRSGKTCTYGYGKAKCFRTLESSFY
jgi:hypothetical protein